MARKNKMATSRKKKRSNNRFVEFFSALLGFWPVWSVLLLVIVSVSGYQYFQQHSGAELKKKVSAEKAQNRNKRNNKKSAIDVKQIRISGHFNYVDIQQLKTQVIKSMQNGYLSSDLETVREKIVAFPWINTVSIKRIPPEAIEINISEHVPMMRWQKKGLVSDRGVLFFPPLTDKKQRVFSSLPLLKVKKTHILVALNFLEQLMPRIQQINLSFKQLEEDVLGGWKVTFAEGQQVIFGRNKLTDRLSMFSKIWPVAKGKGRIERMDLRYTNGAAVAFVKNKGQQL